MKLKIKTALIAGSFWLAIPMALATDYIQYSYSVYRCDERGDCKSNLITSRPTTNYVLPNKIEQVLNGEYYYKFSGDFVSYSPAGAKVDISSSCSSFRILGGNWPSDNILKSNVKYNITIWCESFSEANIKFNFTKP